METQPIRIGTAGWAIRREHHSHYDPGPNHLARYATRFSAVEINSSFYRPHRRTTYERWAASVPAHFRFAVKAPKTITHEKRFADCASLLETFLDEVAGLGGKLGPLLFQLPPKFAFDARGAEAFFACLRARFEGEVVCEPRHASWFGREAETLFAKMGIARVAANPATVLQAAMPGGWSDLVYYRLHGSPRMYYSAYESDYLAKLAKDARRHENAWIIFDNTARGAAVENGLEMMRL
jgi:uncharacterized protein YecE (DUF72 family)